MAESVILSWCRSTEGQKHGARPVMRTAGTWCKVIDASYIVHDPSHVIADGSSWRFVLAGLIGQGFKVPMNEAEQAAYKAWLDEVEEVSRLDNA